MSTTIKYYCDRCGDESREKLLGYFLVASGGPTGVDRVRISREQELCKVCFKSLEQALSDWGHRTYVEEQRARERAVEAS